MMNMNTVVAVEILFYNGEVEADHEVTLEEMFSSLRWVVANRHGVEWYNLELTPYWEEFVEELRATFAWCPEAVEEWLDSHEDE